MRLVHTVRILFLALLGFAFTCPATASTYYLSPTGNDLGSGSTTDPWQTLQKAADSVHPGDTVLLEDGNYVGGARHRTSGTADAPITYQAVHPGKAIVRGDQTTVGDAFTLMQVSYVNVIGLCFHKASRMGLWVSTCNNVTVQQCTAEYCEVTGIFTSFSDDLRLEFNRCYGSVEQHGIYFSNSGDRPVIRFNVCFNNARAGIQVNADASLLKPILGTQGDGITENAIVEGNVLYNNGSVAAAALNMASVRDSLIADNLIFNNKAGGIAMSDDGDGLQYGCKNNLIVHNTIYFRPTQGRWCIAQSNGTTGNTILNNVLWGGYRGAYQFDSTVTFSADYNVCREASNVGTATDADTGNFYSLAEWQAYSGNDLHSTKADPRFVRPSSHPYDFRLVAGSPAIDTGTVLADPTTDIDGNPRIQGALPDLGCYEGAFAPATPTNLAAAVNVTTTGSTVGLTWKASSAGSSYTIKRAVAPQGPYVVIADGITKPAFTDAGVAGGQSYTYVVAATAGGLSSGNSSGATVTTP